MLFTRCLIFLIKNLITDPLWRIIDKRRYQKKYTFDFWVDMRTGERHYTNDRRFYPAASMELEFWYDSNTGNHHYILDGTYYVDTRTEEERLTDIKDRVRFM